MASNPFSDPASPVIAAASVPDDLKADLHDAFFNSKNPEELVQNLHPLAVPDSTKADLFDLKKKLQPAGALPKITEVLNSMSSLDPKTLDIAESHPQVLKTLVAAATKETEQPGEGKVAGKEDVTPKSAPVAKSGGSEAPEEQPDIPPTPPGHGLILASDGGLHHVPTQNIKKAKDIDPNLQVLHVQP